VRADFYREPFRLFFPTGILLGILGVFLWPAYYAGWLTIYPGIAHARLMSEGFMASFIIGFLGTAGPRLTSTAPFSPKLVLGLLTLDLLAAGFHFGNSPAAGDACFVLCLVLFLAALARRFGRAEELPPPNFVLVALGLLNGLAGAILLACFDNQAFSGGYRLGALLLEQGFVLFPILGVAPFLLPRLLNLNQAPPEAESHSRSWSLLPVAVFAALIGLGIDATFIAQTLGAHPSAGWFRFGAILLYLVTMLPHRGSSFLGNCLRLGLAMLLIGGAVEVIWPQFRVGALHLIFVSGFSFIVLTVATRVIFGHGGQMELLRKPLPFFIGSAILIFLAAISRYAAEMAFQVRDPHLLAAALCWIAAALLWIVRVLPKITVAEPEEISPSVPVDAAGSS
jgi:uncharacterized protein involved in response to NO